MIIRKGREFILVGKMSQADREHWHGCLKKIPYRTMGRARKVAKACTKRTGEVIRPYRCDFGPHFHIGHPRKIDRNQASGESEDGN